jgi:hypothetical protein
MAKLMTFLILWGFVLLQSCGQPQLEPSEYRTAVMNPENGLRARKTTQRFVLTLQFLPPKFLALREKKRNGKESSSSIDSLASHYEDFYHFVLSIKPKNSDGIRGKSKGTFPPKLENYLKFKMKNDLSLALGNDTFQCAGYHLERGSGLSSEKRIMVNFPKRNTKKIKYDKKLLINSKPLNVKETTIKISKMALAKFPELNT